MSHTLSKRYTSHPWVKHGAANTHKKPSGYRAILAESLGRNPNRVGEMEPTALSRNRRKRRNKPAKTLIDPPTIRKPQEPGYELPIEGENQSKTRDRNIRNQEKKIHIQWENQCAQ